MPYLQLFDNFDQRVSIVSNNLWLWDKLISIIY